MQTQRKENMMVLKRVRVYAKNQSDRDIYKHGTKVKVLRMYGNDVMEVHEFRALLGLF
jgi:hypothetical protein